MLLCTLSTARGASPAREPEHFAHLHHQPRGDAHEPGKNRLSQAGAFGDQEMPPWHLTSPMPSSLQALPVTTCPKRSLHSVERGSQISPKLLKLEHDTVPVPSNPSSNQWDDRMGPSTSVPRQNCRSVPAASSHTDDAGGDRGCGLPCYPISSSPLWESPIFPNLCAPPCTQSLGQPPLGQRSRGWELVPRG